MELVFRVLILINLCFLQVISSCEKGQFYCSGTHKCIARGWLCDNANDCGDNQDEAYCAYDATRRGCLPGWRACSNGRRCIPNNFWCDGNTDCPDGSDEVKYCDSTQLSWKEKINLALHTDSNLAIRIHSNLTRWLRSTRRNDDSVSRWGPEVHRKVVAMQLSNEEAFRYQKNTRDEMRYEVTIQLLNLLNGDEEVSTNELALYINALLVTCVDPTEFFGRNLVKELRSRVDASGNHTNPFEILVLCNAGDTVTTDDAIRAASAYHNPRRTFWADTQALAVMAFTCVSSRVEPKPDDKELIKMIEDLKKRQLLNGTIDNIRTTALVVQALLANETRLDGFDLVSAVRALSQSQKGDMVHRSLSDVYYILPVLGASSLMNVNNSHCVKVPKTGEEILKALTDSNKESFMIQCSVWIGDRTEYVQTWKIRMETNTTLYDLLEMISKLDSRFKVKYNTFENKPYVSSVFGREDDPEREKFWFTYLKPVKSEGEPYLNDSSPVDIQLQSNQEVILWYKSANWDEAPVTASAPQGTS